MNWIDVAIAALVLHQMVAGYRKRFAGSLLDLAGSVAVAVISLTQFGLVSDLLGRMTGVSSGWLHWFSLFLCLGLSLALVNTTSGVVRRSIRGTSKSFLGSVVGLLVGGARGCVISSLLLVLYIFIPFSDTAREQLDRSALAPWNLSIVPAMVDTVRNRIDPGSPPLMEELERYLRSTQRTARPADGIRQCGVPGACPAAPGQIRLASV